MIQKREGYKGVEIFEEEDRNSYIDNCGKYILLEINIKDIKVIICLVYIYLVWNKMGVGDGESVQVYY